MFDIQLKTENLSEKIRAVLELPGIFARARRSALASTGDMIRMEVRNHIEYGGTRWAKLHPLTLKLRKFRYAPSSPLFYLGRFVRYLIDSEGFRVEIGFGKSSKGEPGQVDDPWLTAAARRAEAGQTTKVTKKVRLVWLSTKIKGTKWKKLSRSGAVTGGYFVLRPETTQLQTPARPIFGPVWAKVKAMVHPHFEAVFWEALERYEKGGPKGLDRSWRV